MAIEIVDIFPLIAWWIFPLLCKRSPEGNLYITHFQTRPVGSPAASAALATCRTFPLRIIGELRFWCCAMYTRPGKRLPKNYGTSPFFMGKLNYFDWAIFHGYVDITRRYKNSCLHFRSVVCLRKKFGPLSWGAHAGWPQHRHRMHDLDFFTGNPHQLAMEVSFPGENQRKPLGKSTGNGGMINGIVHCHVFVHRIHLGSAWNSGNFAHSHTRTQAFPTY